jgi:beta-galactosidase
MFARLATTLAAVAIMASSAAAQAPAPAKRQGTPAPARGARPAARASAPQAVHHLVAGDSAFLLDGRPLQILAGEMHYPRVPRAYWRHRMRMARAMGLNAITTYVFWNLHEPRPGVFDFSGNNDVAAFIRTAQEEGLHVILRPGPYVCAEWDFGGLPWWLLADTTLVVRGRDPHFLAAAGRYLDRLGRELAPLLATRGGPIIAVQVENEYGSFSNDSLYMRAIKDAIIHAGFGGVLLYTADGPGQLPAGALSELPPVVNFGPGDADSAFAYLRRFRPSGPRMAGEWWAGWFDQWGGRHETTDAAAEARELESMLTRGYSVNFYMFHGGTTFGFLNGANYDRRNGYRPQTTSYDYDAAVDEAGRPSRKFALFRDVIARHRPGVALPGPPAPAPVVAIPRFTLEESVPLVASGLLGPPVRAERPQTFEVLGVAFGYVLYRTHVAGPAQGTLVLGGLRDYAVVTLGDYVVGTLDRRLRQDSLQLTVPAGGATLDVLVENSGRINFGRDLVRDWKGLTSAVTFAGRPVSGWEMYRLPLDDVRQARFRRGASAAGVAATAAGAVPVAAARAGDPSSSPTPPTLYRGTVTLSDVGDTWLDLRGWSKGVVWVNGHNLGRFWDIGPQRTLYAPGPWLRRGANEIVVLDLEPRGARSLDGLTGPVLGP